MPRTTGINVTSIETLTDCTPKRHLVKGYKNGKCYAAIYHIDTPFREIERQIFDCETEFHPYNEATGCFL